MVFGCFRHPMSLGRLRPQGLEQEEQSRQNQQLSQSRVRAELQNEITVGVPL